MACSGDICQDQFNKIVSFLDGNEKHKDCDMVERLYNSSTFKSYKFIGYRDFYM